MKNFIFILLLSLFSCSNVQNTSPITESDIYNKTVPAIVAVYSFDDNGELIGQGTGFVLTNTGLIATNHHVIEGSHSLRVAFVTGEKYDVNRITAIDKERDIALINVRGYDLSAISLGNSNNISVGERVIAIGNPLGLSNTLSSGIISGIRTDLEDYKLIQTTTPISPGSSGGPLLNMKGEVIGITTMYLKGGQNLNFAVPVNYLIALNSHESTESDIKISHEDVELKRELADKYYADDDYFSAAKLFFEITESDSTDPLIYFKLGFSLHRIAVQLAPHNEDDPDWQDFANLAIDNFTKSVELEPENEYGFLKIARVHGLWMIDAIKKKRPLQLKKALTRAQQSGGFFPFVIEANRAALTSCSQNSILFTNGDDDTFPAWYLQEIEKVREDVTIVNLALLSVPFYANYLRDFKGLDINLSEAEIDRLEPKSWPRPRDVVIKLDKYNPDNFYVENLPLRVNHSYLGEDYDELSVPDQIVLEIIRQNINTRDIYFGSISWADYSVPFSLHKHTVSEGLVEKLVPQPIERVTSLQKWEQNLMGEYIYSSFSDPRIFGTNISYGFIQRYRDSFNKLARVHHYNADKTKVKEVLSFKDSILPKENIPIPWEKLMEIYEDGELKKIYDYAGMNFKEIDENAREWVETNWVQSAVDTPYYYRKIGNYYLDLDEYAMSRKYIKEYLKYDSKDEGAMVSLMLSEIGNKNYPRAINIANELLEQNPDEIYYNYFLAHHYSSKGEYKKAEKYFNNILYVDDHNYGAYNSFGLNLLYQKDYDRALSHFEKVLEYAPSYDIASTYALENIAETYKAMGENKKAIETLIKVIESDPTMCFAYSKLSILYLLEGNKPQSDDLLQIAKDNMGKDNYGQIGLSCYYSHTGNIIQSLIYLKTAIEMGFDDFSWLKFDPDLANVRESTEFWKLIEG